MPARLILTLAACGIASVAFVASAEARPRREAAMASPAAGPSVDVSRLRALGLGPTADLIQSSLGRELAAGSARGRVAVVVTGFSMNSYAGGEGGGGGGSGGSGGGGGGGSDNDYLEGEILILGPGGQVLESRRQVVSSPASSGGSYYLPGAEQRRVIAVSRAFAEWVRRAAL